MGILQGSVATDTRQGNSFLIFHIRMQQRKNHINQSKLLKRFYGHYVLT